MVSEDGSAVDISFDDYTAVVSNRRKQWTSDCKVTIHLEEQAGVLYAPEVFTLRMARQGGRTRYDAAVDWANTPGDRRFVGGENEASDSFEASRHLYDLQSPCGGKQALEIASTLQNTQTRWDVQFPIDNEASATARFQSFRVKFEARACGDHLATPTQPPPTAATAAPAAVTVTHVTPFGGGCSMADTRFTPSADARGFTTHFDAFAVDAAKVGSGSGLCTLTLALSAAPDRSYAVSAFSVRGVASLPAEASGMLWVTPTWSDSLAVPESQQRTELAGPLDEQFLVEQAIGPDKLQFSQCGAPASELDLGLFLHLASRGHDERVARGKVRITELGPVSFVSRPCDESAGTAP